MLQIVFAGTRGYIEEWSDLHRMHSACLLLCKGKRLLFDCGETWTGRLRELRPDWIAISHAHPDHAFGLRGGTKRPVYVSRESYELLKAFPVSHFRIFTPGRAFRLGPFRVLPYRVIHSLRAPAVGFRVMASGVSLVYNSDIIAPEQPDDILPGVDVYIGDGATLTHPLVRRRGDALFGHTTVRAQLNWCKTYGIPRAYIIHCGKQLVEMDPAELQECVEQLAAPTVQATVAYDGMRIRLGSLRRRRH